MAKLFITYETKKAIVYKALFDWKFYPEMRDEIGFKPMDHLTKKKNQKIN